MKARSKILIKQLIWAGLQGIDCIGSKNERGKKVYTRTLEENLFVDSLSESTARSFSQGDGNELSKGKYPGKMQALHSSSALGVNVFEYWKQNGGASEIALACGLVRKGSDAPQDIVFEVKFPINDKFAIAPNIDIVINNKEGSTVKALAIECKYSEAYGGRGHGGLKEAYLSDCEKLWQDIPNLKALAESISPDDDRFKYLHAAQLIKHILGLKRAYGKKGFRLLYLWYNVFGDEGERHRIEAEEFANCALADGILFHVLTYQALIERMAKTLGNEHRSYINYLVTRYL